MNKTGISIAAGALAVVAASTVWAAIALKPGTYVVTLEMQMPGEPQPMRMTVEDCISEADSRDLKALLMRQIADVEDCKATNLKAAGNKLTFDMHCDDGDEETGDTKIEMTFSGDRFTGLVTMQAGKKLLTSRVDAKWVRAGCAAS
jgi:hypothetical protein